MSINIFFSSSVLAQSTFEPVEASKVQEEQKEIEPVEAQSKNLYKECFLSPDAHMGNIFAPNTDNTAFAVGMLNPINLVITVVASPLILLFWPIKTLK